jgi:hypothetical protein
MNGNAAAGAIQGVPVEHLPAIRAGTLFLLLFYPFLDPLIPHKLEMIDYFFMVPNAVYHMDLGKILQPFTGKVRALEAPGHLPLLCTAAETVPAVAAGRIDVVGKASVAANFFRRNPTVLGHLL